MSNVMFMACGSFSPPTYMHLRMFELARDYFLDMGHHVLGGIISPVHDSYAKVGLIAAKHRSTMVKLSLQSSDWIRLSDWECSAQDKWTPTRQTLQYHQNYINSYLNDINGTVNEIIPGWIPENIKQTRGNVQLKLLCGADLIESFAVPGLWAEEDIEAILSQHGVIVISRAGSNPEKFIFESNLLTKYKKNITIITNWVPNEVSSSIARKLLGRGCSVKYLLDDFVIEYIKKQQLFGTANIKLMLSPNQNTVSQQLTLFPNHLMNDNSIQNLNITNYRYDDMDETDFSSKPSFASDNDQRLGSAARVFCCGGSDPLNVKSLLGRPGGAVKIVTNAIGAHTIERDDGDDEVGATKSLSTILLSPHRFVDKTKVEYLSDNHLDKIGGLIGGGPNGGASIRSDSTCFETLSEDEHGVRKMPGTSARSQNDLIQFVFTSHGIRVISDKEYVV